MNYTQKSNRLIGYVEDGETLPDAIARVAVMAGQNGIQEYEIRCRGCGQQIDICRCGPLDSQTPQTL